MNILALDIDDCILPSENTYFGRINDSIEILKLNLVRISRMIEKYQMQVFITSSWHSILELDGSDIKYRGRGDFENAKDFYKLEFAAFELLAGTLNGYVIGLSKGDRFEDIEKLLGHGCRVIALDDMDLSSITHHNFLFVESSGFLTNDLTFKIDNFFKKDLL